MTVRNSIHALAGEIVACRRALHENPQTAYEETFASQMIADKLTEWGIPFERGIAATGIVATIEGERTGSGKTIGLRADMDALDILEKSGQDWSSKTPGKMHGCGHDGHASMLLGAAKYLSNNRDFNGKVHLIFQPAEESGHGAEKMIAEGLFERFPMQAIYGMHNWPTLPKGVIALNPGPIMASSDTFELVFHGKGGHAAMPESTVDPLVLAAQFVTDVQALVSRCVDPVDAAVVSITNFNCGTGAKNVIADTAILTGSVRAFKPETRAMLERRIGDLAHALAGFHGAQAEYSYTKQCDPTINHADHAALCADVARKTAGEASVITNVLPCMAAEDFGSMLQKVPGCYIWMGQGEPDTPESPHNKGLHHPGYDFNDSIIPMGIEYWVRLVETALGDKSR